MGLQWSFWSRLSSVGRSLGEWSTGLVVWKIGLSGVREERHHSSDSLCGSGFAGRNGNQQLHKVVIDTTRSRLDNVDILSSDRVLNLNSSLSDSEFREDGLSGWYPEHGADA